jgi:hypothetical protein
MKKGKKRQTTEMDNKEIVKALKEILAEMKTTQEVLAKIDANQEKMEAAVHSIQSDLNEKIQRRMENVVECVDHKTQELTERIEKTQLELQAVEVSLDTRVRKLEENLENMRTDFITNLTMVHLGAKPTNRETLTQLRSMEEKIETNKRELQAQLEEVKAIAKRGTRRSRQNSTGQHHGPCFSARSRL